MKNIINYYYGINADDYKKKDNSFIFYYKEIEYEFVEYYDTVTNLLDVYSLLKINGRISDEIVMNKKNEVITYYENKPFILLKKINIISNEITLNEIVNYDFITYRTNKVTWKNLWSQKLDYYEMQLDEIGKKYPLLKQSFNYYLGLSEIAINVLNFVDYAKVNYYICHRRLESSKDLLNPLNMLIDNRTRDIAEFIKIKYIEGEMTIEEIEKFLNSNIFNEQEILLFFSRLIYPSYYFDVYEKIYTEKQNEKTLNKIIKKNVYYETFLKRIYNFIKIKYNIIQIEFLEN